MGGWEVLAFLVPGSEWGEGRGTSPPLLGALCTPPAQAGATALYLSSVPGLLIHLQAHQGDDWVAPGRLACHGVVGTMPILALGQLEAKQKPGRGCAQSREVRT